MRAEASTLAGLIALLQYAAKLFQETGAPGLPIDPDPAQAAEIVVQRLIDAGFQIKPAERCAP
jgi:hypothetical protein